MDWLKDILGDLATDEVIEKFKKEFPKHAVPKEQYSKKTAELEALTTQLESQKQTLADLETKTGDAEAIKASLNTIKAEYDTFKNEAEKRLTNTEKKAKLELALSKAFIEDSVPLIINNLSMDEYELKDGNIRDLDEHVTKLKTKYPTLSKVVAVDGEAPPTGAPSKPIADTTKLSDAEYYKTVGVKPLWGKA
jgi:molecular chaperone GrpE (heat shock protein)